MDCGKAESGATRVIVSAWVGGLALAAFATVAIGAPLPDYIFSLTAWTKGRDIEFLLINATLQTVETSNVTVQGLSYEVTDSAGGVVIGGFARLREAPPARAAAMRRLRPNRVLRQTLDVDELAASIDAKAGAPLDRGQRYRLSFQTEVPVKADDGAVLTARVRSRSVCTLVFEADRPRATCGSG